MTCSSTARVGRRVQAKPATAATTTAAITPAYRRLERRDIAPVG